MRVLVTGATSFTGRATVRLLESQGHVVTTMQRTATDLGARQITGSVTDADAADAAVAGQQAVIHLAAKVDLVGDWDEFEQINVEGTRRLVRAAQHAGVNRFVHVSTPSVAHGGHSLVGVEAEPANPETTGGHYATSKAAAELLALDASSAAMPVVAIRPHLVIGPGDTQLVGRVVERATQGRLPLIGTGLALVDVTWVDNAAAALVAAMHRAPHVAGRALVVSNGEPRTVHELFARITRAAGVDWSPRSVPTGVAVAGGKVAEQVWDRTSRKGDPPMTAFGAEQLSTAHWFDQRETRRVLLWVPRVSLSQGFDQLATWYRRNR